MQKTKPYLRLMRLHQPVGIWLVYWPCVWALLLAGAMDWLLLLLFLAGAVVTRSAGCIVNDMADREFDKHVERTKNRPLASGEISMQQAFVLLAALCLLALGVLAGVIQRLPVDARPHELVAITLPAVGLIVAYPFMKRITWWPQAFLGFTFNWGVFIAWFAATGGIAPAAYCLYAACFFWTLGYDTIYGHQDKKDDSRIGIKSTSLRLGNHSKIWISVFYAAMILLFVTATFMAQSAYASFFPIVFIAFALLVQVKRVNLDSPVSCMAAFKSNGWLGLIHVIIATFATFNA